MTQFSLASVDPTAMEMVDDAALATNDLKSCRAPEQSPVCDESPQDNQLDNGAQATCAAARVQADETMERRKVVFHEADVIEFEPTVWTATISSDGVPVGLSSTVRRRTRRRLDSFEGERLLQRSTRQEYMEHGYLEPDERLDMLETAGHSITILSHVERENVRHNRERWESNEYDLLYQFGLGEPATMDLDDATELLLSQGTILGLNPGFHGQLEHEDEDVVDDEEDGDDEMLEAPDEEGNPAEYYYYSNCVPSQSDTDVRFAMEEIDAYDSRKYEEWAWDYTTDGDDGCQQQYGEHGFDLPSLDFGLPELSSSPTDVSNQSACMVVSCGKIIGLGSPMESSPKSKTRQASGMLV